MAGVTQVRPELEGGTQRTLKELIGHIAGDLYHDVEIEPNLLPMTGETLHHSANQQPDARLDISIRGLWQRGERAFADVRIFNPFAPTHLYQKLEKCFSICIYINI